MDGLPIPDNVPWADSYYNATRTDWQDEFFQNGVFQDYNLQISGGSDRNTFNANLNYRNEEGTQLNTWFERINFSLRSTQKITDRFRVEENVRLAHTNDQLNEEGEGTSVGIYSAYRFHPSLPLKNEDGSWGSGRAHTELGDMWNPIYKTTEEWRRTKGLSAFVNLKGEYDITRNLTLVGNVAYQQRLSLYENFQNTTPEQSRSINYPLLQEGNSLNSEVLGELFARYNQVFGSHDIAATFGSTVQYNTGSFMNMSGEGFSSVDKSQLVMSNADIINGNGGEPASTSLLSYFVRGTYNYGDKYYFSGILRADGSSRFAVGNQWGYFPAISAGWRISSESFMDSDLISNLKINVGWGQLGNQNVAAFQYLNIYTKDQRYIINGENVTGTRLTSFANPDITWETTTTINALLELGLLDDKINLNVAYFDRQTTDMLIPSIKHFTSGIVNLPDANIGEMRNHGVELELSHNNVLGDFEYNIGVNATFLKNKLNRLYGESSFLENGISRTYEGEPIASFYGWKTDGVYQTQGEIDSDANILADPRKTLITPGDIRFVDINGDNLVNESDRTRIGDGNPNLLMGVVLDLSYKGIGFSAVFSGAFGQELYDAMMMRGIDPTLSANMDAVAYQRWTGPGSTSKWPRMSTIRANDNYRFSELGLKNGDYLRMKDVNLSYTFPAALIESFRIADLRVYISGRNLLTVTDFDGVDPEETGRTNLSRGVILNNYPQSKTIILGLNLTF
jgi:TonB-linked SusC/RagA family outer membrane protein